jgi:hypothetical protein
LGAESHLTTPWTGVLASPIAWGIDLVVCYALVKWSCGHRSEAVMHVMTVAALGVMAGGAWTSWRALTLASSERERFVAKLGLLSSALFMILVVAIALPIWVLDACM